MTDILPPAGWLNVRQLETNEFATGGSNGNMNEQAKSLAARSELLKQYAALPYESKTGGYSLNEHVQLETGDIVRSTIASNLNNPNENMTGWVKTNDASQVVSAGGSTQQEINDFGGAKWYEKPSGYKLGATVKLANGDIVKATVANNTNNPNSDMTGWLNLSSATTVATTSDLTASIAYKNGQEIYVQSRTSATHKGGGRFYFDSSRTAENDGVTVFNGWVRSKTDKLKPEWAGAIGDGVADDSAAFRLIRDVGVARARAISPYNVNLAVAGYIVSLDPRAKYLVKGANLLGSNEPESPTNPKYSINFEVEGNGSCINYEPLSEFDNLFNVDAFIERPIFKNFNLYVKASLPQKSGVIWKIRSGYGGYSGAQRAHISDIRIDSMSGTSNRIRRVFDISGTTQADQILVDQCMFGGFNEFWKSDNQESVNNTVKNCSFNTTTSGGSTYFNISRLGDNFNVVDCNMSMTAGDTFCKFIAPLNVAGTLIESNPYYQFHIVRPRIELYGSGEILMLDSNHLTTNFSDITTGLASGAGTVKLVYRSCEMGGMTFDKVNFTNAVKILTPVISSKSFGNLRGIGVSLSRVSYQSSLELGSWDGTTEYAVKDTLIGKKSAKSITFDKAYVINTNSYYDFDIIFDDDLQSQTSRYERSLRLQKAGTGLATEFRIPPYQCINEISITNVGVLPATFTGWRVYFGTKASNNFIDVMNEIPSSVANTDYVIFKGKGIIFNNIFSENVISVYPLDSGVEFTSKLLSSLKIKYSAVNTYSDNITSTSNAVIIKNTNTPMRNIGTTAQRPTVGLYVGYPYFDTTINKPIFCKALTPIAWIDAIGTVV